MADDPFNLMLEHLKVIRTDVGALREDVRELKQRVTGVETGLNAVRRDLVALAEADARLQVTIDRQADRLDRIERRLDLREVEA
ncbi:hypothetical protein D3874_10345 [Oleomonas cavernae]|uniref:Uncharacterized protein n=1 Tax=Oleomonas cavernae TaxID=2320859 RepID=A0A418WBF7_9PROT|nr:hypothetical protein [Oleomonas cavernae]RJF87371.1 hypothetical protein D3874_10345 [Oleomonas cavernae]